jgi:hypothetical protein
MNKKTEQELTLLLGRLTDELGGTVHNQLEFSKLLDRIVDLIAWLVKSVSAIFFVLALLVWRVFLWSPLSTFLNHVAEGWSSLPDGYKILILGIPGAIISGIISHVVGALLLAKIRSVGNKGAKS